ncbi:MULTISPECIES: hypothetical protein [Methylotenera]|uniref:hypothetical protein n=1 Tax=Methylotenera TaxID=359407 RepID=UPI0003720F6B|nr:MULTISPECIES: hypothetical protein [Methylotenera]
MKSLNLAVIVSSAVLMLSGVAYAEDTYKNSHHQNLSKRPYSQPLPDSAYQKTGEFEGATLVRGELSEQELTANKHQQVMRLNQLSKRPY